MKIKGFYVNHENETFAVMSMASLFAEVIHSKKDLHVESDGPFGGVIYLSENERIEYFMSSSVNYIRDFNQRLEGMTECGYDDISDWYEVVTE